MAKLVNVILCVLPPKKKVGNKERHKGLLSQEFLKYIYIVYVLHEKCSRKLDCSSHLIKMFAVKSERQKAVVWDEN